MTGDLENYFHINFFANCAPNISIGLLLQVLSDSIISRATHVGFYNSDVWLAVMYRLRAE